MIVVTVLLEPSSTREWAAHQCNESYTSKMNRNLALCAQHVGDELLHKYITLLRACITKHVIII